MCVGSLSAGEAFGGDGGARADAPGLDGDGDDAGDGSDADWAGNGWRWAVVRILFALSLTELEGCGCRRLRRSLLRMGGRWRRLKRRRGWCAEAGACYLTRDDVDFPGAAA